MAREIVVVPYDEGWPRLFAQEKVLLQEIFHGLQPEIHHHGSTSVPGLSAKPIIDIMVVVEDLGLVDGLNQAMEAAGYVVRGENGIPGRRYFVRLHPDGSGNHTHHVHVYQRGNPKVVEELAFRDYLRANPISRKEYQGVKITAAEHHRYSPMGYTEAKAECVERLTTEAKRWFATTDLEFKTNRGNFLCRTAAIIINQDRVLLETCADVDFWAPPGGTVGFGESSTDALEREVLEELGEQVEVGRLLWISEGFFHYKGHAGHAVEFYYAASLPKDSSLLALDTFERRDKGSIGTLMTFRWHALEQIDKINILPKFLQAGLKDLPLVTQHIVHI